MDRLKILGVLALLALAASACSPGYTRSDFSLLTRRASPRLTPKEQTVLMTARSLIGAPYRYGGTTPRGFDCSGYVRYVFQKAVGIRLPRTAGDQVRNGSEVALADLRPADLVYFKIRRQKSLHVGIYIGRGKFIHAPSSRGKVNIQNLNMDYWTRSYRGARRVL
jgi:cell wall-associated NlpC family hydrolase